VFGRLLYWQVRRFCTTKNAIHVGGCASPLIDLVDSIGNESALSGMKSKWIDRRQPAPRIGSLLKFDAGRKHPRCRFLKRRPRHVPLPAAYNSITHEAYNSLTRYGQVRVI